MTKTDAAPRRDAIEEVERLLQVGTPALLWRRLAEPPLGDEACQPQRRRYDAADQSRFLPGRGEAHPSDEKTPQGP